ncbi:hypothetical protein ACFO5X_24060 [Seohaeicola nanhaiensis]|uniref:Tat pathway signal sequence domain protein n=1 Tax=Seohaeicola nanhaiensis TaxID=1387282 RepID=A0ABV9KNL9_9RHOB
MRPALTLLALASLALASQAMQAQEAAAHLSVELNKQDADGDACRLTFVVTNANPEAIDSAVFETVLFDDTGSVDRLTLFDFGALPPGRARVRQFQVAGLACDRLSRVLFNGASTCTVAGQPSDICAASLEVTSRTETEVLR